MSSVKNIKAFNTYLIGEKNIYPKYYAWWDEKNQVVEIHKYNK